VQITTSYDLAVSQTTTTLTPLEVRSVDVERHECGFALIVRDCMPASPGEVLRLVLDAEGMKTLISAIAHPSVLNAVKRAHMDHPAILSALENVQR